MPAVNIGYGFCKFCERGLSGYCLTVNPGDTVVIYCAGPVGLLAATSAYIKGASQVFVVDTHKDRLKLAEKSKDGQCYRWYRSGWCLPTRRSESAG